MQDSRVIEPYVWDPNVETPKDVLELWEQVGSGIDKSQTGTFISLLYLTTLLVTCRFT
jgi:hypothetical protein